MQGDFIEIALSEQSFANMSKQMINIKMLIIVYVAIPLLLS